MKLSNQSQSKNTLRSSISGLLGVLVVSALLLFNIQPAAALQTPPSTVPPPHGGIYKAASKQMLSAGQTMTYTIHLETDSNVTLMADVADPLPDGLDYVDGTVNQSGIYDPATRTVAWSNVPVTRGSPVNLTFDVKDTASVTRLTPVVNTASINLSGLTLQRQAWVMLLPPGPAAFPLAASFKSAEPFRLGPGDKVTYTIHLLNAGNASATVTVSDPVPGAMTYVAGSASTAGVYDETAKAITWTGVEVPPATPVLLTFEATAPDVTPAAYHPTVVTNTATITSDALSFMRSAEVLLVRSPESPLAGSFKAASQRYVRDGGKLTFTIYLHNSSSDAVPASVSDALPVGLDYIDGSANAGGTYDVTSRTLTWTDLSVLEDSPQSLTFDVTVNNPLATPAAVTHITNTAEITSGSVTLKRSAEVFVVSTPGGDIFPPEVKSFVIGDRDVYSSPQVTLHTSASDNVGVTSMCFKEWVLATAPMPHWQQVKNCDKWVPFQADYDWTLTSQSGTHFIEVWVADAALNHSHLTRKAIDFASLLLPNTHVDLGDMIPYLVYYPAGVDVSATLTTLTGDAQLHVWHPGNMFAPDHSSPATGGATQTISFTTKWAGVYLFLVRGKQASDFDLSITPGGGATATTVAPLGSAAGINMGGQAASPAQAGDPTYNPILPQSGLDPLSVSQDPIGPFNYTYLPLIVR